MQTTFQALVPMYITFQTLSGVIVVSHSASANSKHSKGT